MRIEVRQGPLRNWSALSRSLDPSRLKAQALKLEHCRSAAELTI